MNLETIQKGKLKSILQFGIPSIIAMVLTSLITVADGFFIGNYVGKEGLAAVNLGLPIVYLYLAMGLMVSVGGVAIAGIIVFLLVLIGSGWYSSMFVKNDAIEQMVRSGATIYAISFLFSGVNTITSFYFTSIGKAVESAIISSARGLVLLLACIFILPPLLGMTGVWLVAPVTEGLTLLLSFTFIAKDNRIPCKI